MAVDELTIEQAGRVFTDYDISELREYIDWQPFFSAWEIRGRFPDVLNNPATGEAARRLYEDAQAMLDRIVEERWLRAVLRYQNGQRVWVSAHWVDTSPRSRALEYREAPAYREVPAYREQPTGWRYNPGYWTYD